MFKDYHYDMIKILARTAGFAEEEAQDIAYASQYVDDALEFLPSKIENLSQSEGAPLILDDGRFDVVCTAHDGILLQAVGGCLSTGQWRTYLPFHFVPRHKKGAVELSRYDYRTAPDCDIARELVERAVAIVKPARAKERTRALIRLGIALHTYADTWAHQDFSGIYSEKDNMVSDIQVKDKGVWTSFKPDYFPSVVPATGHANVHTLPDTSHITWRYRNRSREIRERDNVKEYLEASKKIFGYLCSACGSQNRWMDIEHRVRECLAYDTGLTLDSKAAALKRAKFLQVFPDIKLDYSPVAWKNTMTYPDGRAVDWDNIKSDPPILPILRMKDKKDLRWIYFHLEASAQRQYVHQNVEYISESFDLAQTVSLVRNLAESALNSIPFLAAAKKLEEKSGWLTVEIVNNTRYPLIWMPANGNARDDFNLNFNISYTASSSGILGFFEKAARVGADIVEVVYNTCDPTASHGRYWDPPPAKIAPFSMGRFSACEEDHAQTGAGGVTRFHIQAPSGVEFAVDIAFERPVRSDRVKVHAEFQNNRHGSWNNLNDSHYYKSSTECKYLPVEVSVYPGQRSRIVLVEKVK